MIDSGQGLTNPLLFFSIAKLIYLPVVIANDGIARSFGSVINPNKRRDYQRLAILFKLILRCCEQ